jgi:predicted ArsR family transcriptional regulator
MERDRVTVQEAARRLGISESGVRKRVKREQLDSERSSTHDRERGGRVYVYLDRVVTDADPVPDSVPDKYVASLEDQVESLREQLAAEREANRENRRIIIALTSRVPELEASREPPRSPTPSPEASEGTTPQPGREEAEEPAQRRPWWRRIFGG